MGVPPQARASRLAGGCGLPTAANTKEKKDEPKTITVAIKKDTSTFLGGVRVERQPDLVGLLKEKLEDVAEGNRVVYLKADAELPYSEVMKVMDLCREAGVDEVALIADRKVEGGGA